MISDDILETIDIAIRAFKRAELDDPYGHLPEEMVHIDKVLDWLESLPKAPEPPWENAPKTPAYGLYSNLEPEWCTLDADGLRKWHYEEPKIYRNEWRSLYFRYEDLGCVYVDLPIGIDWRTTLRKRPEADNDTE